MDGWVDEQMWSIRTTEYGSAIKRNENLAQATTRMNPENTGLSKINQIRQGKYYTIPLMRYLE